MELSSPEFYNLAKTQFHLQTGRPFWKIVTAQLTIFPRFYKQ